MPRRYVPALLVVQAVAFWPVWRWAAARVAEGDADEIAALLAAGAALLIVRRAREPSQHGVSCMSAAAAAGATWCAPDPRAGAAVAWSRAHDTARAGSESAPLLGLPTVLTFVYAALAVVAAPPLLRAMVAACALLATWCAWRWNARPHAAALGLVLLVLPALPTAHFVLGFPLRAGAGEIAARLLQLTGLAVVREGVSLRMGERLVAIDAPCSGVNMLWMAVLLALVLAALGGASAGRTASLVFMASVLALVGNAMRAASLFLIDCGIAPLPGGIGEDSVHVGLGVVAFAIAAAPLVWMARRRPAHATRPVMVDR